ncbi:MAG: hypothetical protein ABJE63_03955 [Lentilitoribacter sp.]
MSKLLILSTFALSLSTSAVFAESNLKMAEDKLIETSQGSVIVFGCPSCKEVEEEVGIVLDRGTQIFEMRKVGEDKKLYRVENWLGGSPVAFAHVTSSAESVALLLGNGTERELANIDESAVSSIGATEPSRLAIYGPAQPKEDRAIATLEDGDDSTPLGPDIEPNLMPAIAAATSMPAGNVKIELEDKTMAMAKEPSPIKELDAGSFSLRLN